MYHVVFWMFPEVIHFQVAIVWCGAIIPPFLKKKSDYLLRRLLDVTHLILICQSCYHYLVTNWGNGPALLISTHELDLHLIFVGIATLVCQGFFLHRWGINFESIFTAALLKY
jgi:hypothetical protein